MITESRFYTMTTAIEGTDYYIICIPEGTEYSFYLQPADHSAAMCYMVGLPMIQQSIEEAFNMAENYARVYFDQFAENFE